MGTLLRQRDLLPLPCVPVAPKPCKGHSSHGRDIARTHHTSCLVNDVVHGINELGGFCIAPQYTPNVCQDNALSRIKTAVARFGGPPAHTSMRRALRELTSSSPTYASVTTKVAIAKNAFLGHQKVVLRLTRFVQCLVSLSESLRSGRPPCSGLSLRHRICVHVRI